MFNKSSKNLIAIIAIAVTVLALYINVRPAAAHPTTARAHNQLAVEQTILASTLRFEMRSGMIFQNGAGLLKLWGVGHGTVKQGRYLVTHNHFDSIVFSDELGNMSETLSLSFYKADGSLLTHLTNHPATAQFVGETVIFDFGAGFFDRLGVPSATFVSNAQGLIRPNATVAQINWNQSRAFVEWTTVRSVTVRDGISVIELDNAVIKGASGGGIFLNGQHIANNWKVISISNANSGVVSDSFTVAALNG